MIDGVNHITLSVCDLEESFAFYKDVMGFRPLAKRQNKSAYFLAGTNWIALVLDQKKTPEPNEQYAHIAFSVTPEKFEDVCSKIISSGALIWQENSSPGKSLYFLDPSGNKLEIHSSDWQSRIKWLRKNPSAGLEIYD